MESGHSWQRAFTVDAGRDARAWVAAHVLHADAALIAAELWNAVLATDPDKIELTVSTAGDRARITAAGPEPMPDHALYGPGASLVWELSTRHGIAPDTRGIWAEVVQEMP